MLREVAAAAYRWGPGRRILRKAGLELPIRECWNRLAEWTGGTRLFEIEGVSVWLARRSVPGSEYLDAERLVIRDLLERLRKSDVFWDVGADKGLYACIVASKLASGGRVVAFEPHPLRRRELLRNLSRNGLGAQLRLEALSDLGGSAWLSYGLVSERELGEVEVPVRSGDSLVEAGAVPTPNVVKIDVEGAECAVIRGLDRTLDGSECRLMYVELHQEMGAFGDAVGDVERLLSDHGFELTCVASRPRGKSTQKFLRAWRPMRETEGTPAASGHGGLPKRGPS